jgi:hypothetical protein
MVQNALAAAVSALNPTDLFGIITFSDSLGVYDLRAACPSVRQVQVPANGQLPLTLDEVLPLPELLVPVEKFAAQIQAAIDSLALPEVEPEADAGGPSPNRKPKRKAAFGSAVWAGLGCYGYA